MGFKSPKWFSLRTDLYSRDSYQLGLSDLTPAAFASYVAGVAYASKWGIDTCFQMEAARVGVKRVKPIVSELVDAGLWLPSESDKPTEYIVAHEGVLWRRGDARKRHLIPVATRAAVMERDNYACVECSNTETLSIDHIWPYSLGGGDEMENLRVLCQSCNSRKGARV